MNFAYADPPYPGYEHFYEGARRVNHRVLIGTLEANFDGWALSTSVPTLASVLSLCPEGVRVASWVKTFASFKKNVRVAYAWEPVIFRPAKSKSTGTNTVRDWCACPITMRRGFVGAKPDVFCRWLFSLLGMGEEDSFDDVFVGSGAVSRAWQRWKSEGCPLFRQEVEMRMVRDETLPESIGVDLLQHSLFGQ